MSKTLAGPIMTWGEMASEIERILDVERVGGGAVTYRDKAGATFQLPTLVAMRIIELANDTDKLRNTVREWTDAKRLEKRYIPELHDADYCEAIEQMDDGIDWNEPIWRVDGRAICMPNRPWRESDGLPVSHINAECVGSTSDDRADRYRCPDCGTTWVEELPE